MELVKYLYSAYKKYDFDYLAAQTSYFLLLSFIPFLGFIFAVLGNLNLPTEDIYNYLSSVLPTESYIFVSLLLSEILNYNSKSIMSLLLALLFSSKGVRAIIVALNRGYCHDDRRKGFHLYALSLIFTLLLVFILVLTLFALVFGRRIGEIVFDFLGVNVFFNRIWTVVRYTITILFLILAFSLIYKYAPSSKEFRLKSKDVIRGSVFATISLIIVSGVFAFYVNNYNRSYSALYGSLGGLFALLIWLYLSSVVIILGGQVNVYYFKINNGI